MLHTTAAAENMLRTPASRSPKKMRSVSPTKSMHSPFKQGKASASQARSAFADKTNMSPSPERHAGASPKKAMTPWGPRLFGSYVTPAANVGRAGMIKARMGELRDAQIVDEPEAEHEMHAADESIPEIEYMPPPQAQPYFFPDALDGLPGAQEVGEMMRTARFVGWTDEAPDVPCEPPEELPVEAPPVADTNPYPDQRRVPARARQPARQPVRQPVRPPFASRKALAPGAPRGGSTLRSGAVSRAPVTRTRGGAPGPRADAPQAPTLAAALAHPALRDLANDALGRITAQVDVPEVRFSV